MNEQLIFDLHCHTTASDGRLTPTEVVERAHNNGVDTLAITDHDTLAGLSQAHDFINAMNLPLKLINGVEISSHWHGFDIHVVALQVDIENQALLDFCHAQNEKRLQRAQMMASKLEKAGVVGALEGAIIEADGSAISRAHFAAWMIKNNYAKDFKGIFKKYLAKGKIGYVPNQWLELAEVIGIIHQAGGVAVLAHPSRYKLSAKWLRKLVHEFKAAGGDAMEVVLSQQGVDERNHLIGLCNQNQLLASIGSDFHFESPWVDLGKNLYQPSGCEWVWQGPQWRAN